MAGHEGQGSGLLVISHGSRGVQPASEPLAEPLLGDDELPGEPFIQISIATHHPDHRPRAHPTQHHAVPLEAAARPQALRARHLAHEREAVWAVSHHPRPLRPDPAVWVVLAPVLLPKAPRRGVAQVRADVPVDRGVVRGAVLEQALLGGLDQPAANHNVTCVFGPRRPGDHILVSVLVDERVCRREPVAGHVAPGAVGSDLPAQGDDGALECLPYVSRVAVRREDDLLGDDLPARRADLPAPTAVVTLAQTQGRRVSLQVQTLLQRKFQDAHPKLVARDTPRGVAHRTDRLRVRACAVEPRLGLLPVVEGILSRRVIQPKNTAHRLDGLMGLLEMRLIVNDIHSLARVGVARDGKLPGERMHGVDVGELEARDPRRGWLAQCGCVV